MIKILKQVGKSAHVLRIFESLKNYNYELEVIAKNESNEVVGHVLLAEITLTSQNDKQTALAIGALSVNSEVRKQGLGKALIQAVEER